MENLQPLVDLIKANAVETNLLIQDVLATCKRVNERLDEMIRELSLEE